MKHTANKKIKAMIFLSMALYLSGCSQTSFELAKQSALSKQVITSTPGNSITNATTSVSSGSTATSVGVGNVPVQRFCSTAQTINIPVLKPALSDSSIPVELFANRTKCSISRSDLINEIMSTSDRNINLSQACANISNLDSSTLEVKINGVAASFIPENSEGLTKLLVYYARNKDAYLYPENQRPDSNCEFYGSPLAIHIGQDPDAKINLSSHEDGISFDLLGNNLIDGSANNHQKVQISWFSNSEYGLLALPNRQGQVLGIDELFGDNTMGPDGKYAANGYAALAKFDLNSDGRIDKMDSILSELRIWIDQNRDGISQKNELSSLEDHQIEFIDLKFDAKYREVDQFGNEIKMKSVVGKRNGSLDLIFDIWFKY